MVFEESSLLDMDSHSLDFAVEGSFPAPAVVEGSEKFGMTADMDNRRFGHMDWRRFLAGEKACCPGHIVDEASYMVLAPDIVGRAAADKGSSLDSTFAPCRVNPIVNHLISSLDYLLKHSCVIVVYALLNKW